MSITEDDSARIANALEAIARDMVDLAPEPPYTGHTWVFLRQEDRIVGIFPHGAVQVTYDVFHCSGCPECSEEPAYRLVMVKQERTTHDRYENRPIWELATPPTPR